MSKCLWIPVYLFSLAAIAGASDVAERAFRQGLKAEHSGDHLQAYFLYSEAAQADPANPLYSGRAAALMQSAALHPITQVVTDPANETITAQLEQQGLVDDAKLDSPAARLPPRFAGSPEAHTFRIKGSARAIFEQVAGAYGIHVLFDPAYQDPPAFTFAIADAGYRDALRALQAAGDSILVPLDESTAFVARDTPQNRAQLTPVVAMAVPIPERMTLQEAQELATAVQQTLEIRRISLDAAKRAVYFRDAASKAYTAREMFMSLSRLRGQIAVDVQLLSVSKTSSLSYGLALPTSAAIVDFGVPFKGAVPSIPPGLPNFARFAGGGGTLLGIGIANATAFATLTQNSAATLLEGHLVSLDGQPATFRVGDRYPVTTGIISGGTGPATQGLALPPLINFVDLGLSLKLTPAVHEDGEVSLDIEAQFSTLGTAVVNGIPSIATQQYQGKVRLKDNEWAVVAGLVNVTHIENPTGIAGLSNIPWIGNLFREQQREDDRSDILLVLKPHLIAEPAWETEADLPIWTGTETRPVTVF